MRLAFAVVVALAALLAVAQIDHAQAMIRGGSAGGWGTAIPASTMTAVVQAIQGQQLLSPAPAAGTNTPQK
jgi:hypothetical protein